MQGLPYCLKTYAATPSYEKCINMRTIIINTSGCNKRWTGWTIKWFGRRLVSF